MISDPQKLLNLHDRLVTDRSTWDSQYKELAEYIAPRRGRWVLTDTNKGQKKNEKIINSTATIANRVQSAGMHAGISSPARPWFRVTHPDPRLAERGRVKEWLHRVVVEMMLVMARSNFYNGLSLVYGDLGVFGTSTIWIDEDDTDVIRTHVLPCGEACLLTDHSNRVNGVFRKVYMRVDQMVGAFGRERLRPDLQKAYENGDMTTSVEVRHIVLPRSVRDIEKIDSLNMPYASYWLDPGAPSGQKLLKEGGYEEFPSPSPRWGVTGNDIYGSGNPGMDCLGDVKGLQTLERRKAQIVDKLTNPPMKGSSELRNERASLLPGDITYVAGGTQGVFEPALKMDPNAVKVIGEEIMRHENRIKEAFMADLWLMMAQSDRREITAREVDERHEEKMLQLGPTLERLQDELLDPCIDRIFSIMMRRGLLPPPPPELRNQELRVEYVSILAQAQKLLSTSGVERLVTFGMNVGNVEPSVKDNFNWDRVVKHYADILGTKPDLLNSEEEVAGIRDERMQKEQMAVEQARLQNESKAASQLARADTSGQNALTELMGTAGGPMADALAGTMQPQGE